MKQTTNTYCILEDFFNHHTDINHYDIFLVIFISVTQKEWPKIEEIISSSFLFLLDINISWNTKGKNSFEGQCLITTWLWISAYSFRIFTYQPPAGFPPGSLLKFKFGFNASQGSNAVFLNDLHSIIKSYCPPYRPRQPLVQEFSTWADFTSHTPRDTGNICRLFLVVKTWKGE